MMLVEGQDRRDEGAMASRPAGLGEHAGPARPGEMCCRQALLRLAAAGNGGAQALPTISGCDLCQRSVMAAPAAPGGPAPAGWPGLRSPRGLDCPYLTHPSNQRLLNRLIDESLGKDADGPWRRMLS